MDASPTIQGYDKNKKFVAVKCWACHGAGGQDDAFNMGACVAPVVEWHRCHVCGGSGKNYK